MTMEDVNCSYKKIAIAHSKMDGNGKLLVGFYPLAEF